MKRECHIGFPRVMACVATLFAITCGSPFAEPNGHFSEVTVSAERARPTGILMTSNGTLWFIDLAANKIGRLTASGNITEFTVPTSPGNVGGMTAGSDGNIWFTEWIGGKIGRIKPNGVITEFSLGPCKYPHDIVAASDNALWFTVGSSKKAIAPFPTGCPDYAGIGRIGTDGSVAEFPLSSVVGAIAANQDGSLWFTQPGAIGKITTNGVVSRFPISQIRQANQLIVAPDGTLWFSDYFTETIGHLEMSGPVRLAAYFDVKSRPVALAMDREGRVWFADADTNSLGWITTDGKVFKKQLPTRNAYPAGIAIGSDGAVWFTEYNLGRIGRFTLPGAQ